MQHLCPICCNELYSAQIQPAASECMRCLQVVTLGQQHPWQQVLVQQQDDGSLAEVRQELQDDSCSTCVQYAAMSSTVLRSSRLPLSACAACRWSRWGSSTPGSRSLCSSRTMVRWLRFVRSSRMSSYGDAWRSAAGNSRCHCGAGCWTLWLRQVLFAAVRQVRRAPVSAACAGLCNVWRLELVRSRLDSRCDTGALAALQLPVVQSVSAPSF